MHLSSEAAGTLKPEPGSHLLLWLVIGVLLGGLFLGLMDLSTKWFLTLFAGSLVLGMSPMTGDRKKLYLALLVLSLPVMMDINLMFRRSPVFRSMYGFQVFLSFLPLFALYFIWIFRHLQHRTPAPVRTRGLGLLLALLGWGILSTLFNYSLYALFDLFHLVIAIFLFVYAASQVVEAYEFRLVAICLVISGAIQAVIAILQNITRSDLGLGFFGAAKFIKGYTGLLALTRVMGTLGHPSQLAQFFDITLPISFALLFAPMRHSFKLLLGLTVVLQYIGLGMTYSRGGIFWTSLAMGLIFLVYLSRRMGWVRGVVFSAVMGALFVGLLLVVPNPITKALMRTEYETAYGRLPLMDVAFNIIRDRPLLGVGPNNYVFAALRYDNTPEQLTTAWNTAVHNVYLFIAGEYGLPALILFMAFLASVSIAGWAAIRSPDPWLSYLGLGAFCGTLAFMLHCYTDFTQWTSPRLHWFILGLMVSLGRMANSSAPAAVLAPVAAPA